MSDVMQIEYNPGNAIKRFLLDLGVGKTFTFRDLLNSIPAGAYRSEGALSGALWRMAQNEVVSVARKEKGPNNRTISVYQVVPGIENYDPGDPKPWRYERAKKKKQKSKVKFSLDEKPSDAGEVNRALFDSVKASVVPTTPTIAQRLLDLAAELESAPTDLSRVSTDDLLAEISRRMK